jgi:alkylation response protein AidB-like acyl-CoA dehydrogenase
MNEEIQKIESWLQEQIVPVANSLDREPKVLRSILKQMGDRSWLALKAPEELGGKGLSEAEYHLLQISLARASGALTFLQTQHQSAVAKLAQSKNKFLQQEFFPDVAQGKSLIGVGFSHLRRRGTPMMQATAIAGGYLLTGEVPWITGYGFFSHFIVGTTLTDGRELYGLLPFKNAAQKSGGEIICGEPMVLLAATATNTIAAKINQWYLSGDRLVSINPPGAIHYTSQKNILNHGFFALGCAYAGLDILQTIAKTKQLEFLQTSWQALHQEVKETEEKAIAELAKGITLLGDRQIDYSQKLQLRAEIINLAQRCSQAAVMASGGAANYLNSSAGRVYREALLFSISGQTKDVMEASIKNLLLKKL